MADQLVFPGRINDGAKFEADDEDRYFERRNKLRGYRVELILRKPKSKRSLDQNDYAHKWPFRLIAEAIGCSVEEAKLDILGEKFGWTDSKLTGKAMPVKPSTAKLTTEEFSELIDWMVPWALDTFGIVIPLPGEVM